MRVDGGNETEAPFVLSPLPLSRQSMRAFLVELAEPTIPGETYRFRTRLFARWRLQNEVQEREVTVS